MYADTFYLKDGRVVKGNIIEVDFDLYKIKTEEGKIVVIKKNEVVKVEFEVMKLGLGIGIEQVSSKSNGKITIIGDTPTKIFGYTPTIQQWSTTHYWETTEEKPIFLNLVLQRYLSEKFVLEGQIGWLTSTSEKKILSGMITEKWRDGDYDVTATRRIEEGFIKSNILSSELAGKYFFYINPSKKFKGYLKGGLKFACVSSSANLKGTETYRYEKPNYTYIKIAGIDGKYENLVSIGEMVSAGVAYNLISQLLVSAEVGYQFLKMNLGEGRLYGLNVLGWEIDYGDWDLSGLIIKGGISYQF